MQGNVARLENPLVCLAKSINLPPCDILETNGCFLIWFSGCSIRKTAQWHSVSFHPGHGLCVLRRESRLVSRCSQIKILVGYVFKEIHCKAVLLASKSNEMKGFCIYALHYNKNSSSLTFNLMAFPSFHSSLPQAFFSPVL